MQRKKHGWGSNWRVSSGTPFQSTIENTQRPSCLFHPSCSSFWSIAARRPMSHNLPNPSPGLEISLSMGHQPSPLQKRHERISSKANMLHQRTKRCARPEIDLGWAACIGNKIPSYPVCPQNFTWPTMWYNMTIPAQPRHQKKPRQANVHVPLKGNVIEPSINLSANVKASQTPHQPHDAGSNTKRLIQEL